jgi:hypothetical protein
VVWAAAALGLLVLGTDAFREVSPSGTDPTDSVEGWLLSPAERWDAGWFVGIASHGYDGPTPSHTAFFPLYPLSMRVVGEVVGSFQWAGVVVSLAAFFVGLYFVHRLTELECGRAAAERAVLLLALFPMAFYFSAIYSESLFLALSAGCLYFARTERWPAAAGCAALAGATRSAGLLLAVPLVIMLLRAPRTGRWQLRNLGVVLAAPAGTLAYLAYIRSATRYWFLAPFKTQQDWMREFKGPIVGFWGGVKNGYRAVTEVLWGANIGGAVSGYRSGLVNFGALAFASIGVVGALRRLPLAYGAYALVAVLFAISYPGNDLQLKSLPRLVVAIFPIFMWLGAVTDRRRYRTVALVGSVAGLVVFSAMFASGYWIA